MLPPASMAYGERGGGGFLGAFSVGGCAGVVALCTSFSLSILGPSILVAFAAAGLGSCSLAIPCLCMLARVRAYHLLFLCPRACGLCVWWRWCAVRWRVAPFSRFRGGALYTITSFRMGCPLGIPSYHSCSVLRRWRPLVLRVFFGGVHILFGVGGFLPR